MHRDVTRQSFRVLSELLALALGWKSLMGPSETPGRSLRSRGAAASFPRYRLPMAFRLACFNQFFLKEPIPPKNLSYVPPFSLAAYFTAASSIVQR